MATATKPIIGELTKNNTLGTVTSKNIFHQEQTSDALCGMYAVNNVLQEEKCTYNLAKQEIEFLNHNGTATTHAEFLADKSRVKYNTAYLCKLGQDHCRSNQWFDMESLAYLLQRLGYNTIEEVLRQRPFISGQRFNNPIPPEKTAIWINEMTGFLNLPGTFGAIINKGNSHWTALTIGTNKCWSTGERIWTYLDSFGTIPGHGPVKQALCIDNTELGNFLKRLEGDILGYIIVHCPHDKAADTDFYYCNAIDNLFSLGIEPTVIPDIPNKETRMVQYDVKKPRTAAQAIPQAVKRNASAPLQRARALELYKNLAKPTETMNQLKTIPISALSLGDIMTAIQKKYPTLADRDIDSYTTSNMTLAQFKNMYGVEENVSAPVPVPVLPSVISISKPAPKTNTVQRRHKLLELYHRVIQPKETLNDLKSKEIRNLPEGNIIDAIQTKVPALKDYIDSYALQKNSKVNDLLSVVNYKPAPVTNDSLQLIQPAISKVEADTLLQTGFTSPGLPTLNSLKNKWESLTDLQKSIYKTGIIAGLGYAAMKFAKTRKGGAKLRSSLRAAKRKTRNRRH